MKKQLLIISVFVIIVSIFVSCSAERRDDLQSPSTTAVTDEQGTTHYYEVVTDDTETTALKEIETQADCKAVTEKNGKYVTKEHTVVLTTASSKENKNVSSSNTTKSAVDADNIVDFEPDDTTKPTETTTAEKETSKTTTQKEIQPATDKDGWITKWY